MISSFNLRDRGPGDYWRLALLLFISLYPLLAGTVRHGGGTIYIFLSLFGLLFCLRAWQELDREERIMLLSWVSFGLFVIATLLYTENTKVGVREAETFWRFLMAALLFLLLTKSRANPYHAILLGLCLGGMGMGIMAGLHAGGRTQLAHLDPIKFGQLSAVFAILSAACLFYVGKRWHLIVPLFIAYLAASYAAVQSGTRSAWLALFLCSACILLVQLFRLNRRAQLLTLVIGALAVALLFFYNAQLIVNRIDGTRGEIQNIINNPQQAKEGGGLDTRYNIWLDSIALWRKEPVLGIGVGDYVAEYDKLRQQGLNVSAFRFTDSHNVYIHLLTIGGFVGLCVFIFCLIVVPLKLYLRNYLFSRDDLMRYACLSGLLITLAYICFGMSEVWVRFNPMVNTYLFFSAVFLFIIKQRKSALRMVRSDASPH